MPRPNRGPYIEPNGFGVYEIRWSEGGRSRRRSTGSSDFQFANKILANFIFLEGHEAARVDREGPVMVRAVLGDPDGEAGLDYWHSHVVPNVVDKLTPRYSYAKLLQHFGHLAVKDIDDGHVAAYVAARKAGRIGRPSGPATIARELGVLIAAINFAVKKKRLPAGEAPSIPLPRAPDPKDRWLTYDEADRLIAAAKAARSAGETLPRVYRFVMLALGTASRKAAILELQRDRIDLARGVIYLNPAGRAQTRKRRPVVPISDELRPVLSEILAQIPDKPDAYLLDHPGSIRKAFDGACERAGLADVTPHTLRHTWATWAAQAGVSMYDIAGVLGDEVQTVIDTYLHHAPEHLRSAINAVRRPSAEGAKA